MPIEILHIDCMEYMAELEDNAFELAIVDPPYGIGNRLLKNGNTRTKLASAGAYGYFDNKEPPPREYFIELFRVSQNQIIWGANHFANRFESNSSRWLIWDKHTTGDFADCELAYTSFAGAARKFDYPWNGMIQGYHGTKRFNEKRIHPTQKPIKLYEWLLSNYAKEGDRILDTHLGSGSSAIAAHRGGFDFVGCELDPDFCSAAKERFDLDTAQASLI